MTPTIPFKRLILRVVLRQVSPMVIRLISVPEYLELPKFHNVMRAILGWNGDLGYIIRIHGQEFNSFRRKTRSKALHELKLHRQEKFLYICDTLHMREWDVRVVDIQEGAEEDHTAMCCLRPPAHEQRFRQYANQNSIWSRQSGEPAMEPLPLSG